MSQQPEQRLKPERRGPEYVRYQEYVGERHKYTPILRKIALGIGILAVAGGAAYVAVPQLSGSTAVGRVLSAIEKHPYTKVTSVIYDATGGKAREYVDYIQGESWRGDFDSGKRIHVQTPLFKYVYEKDFNLLRTYTSDSRVDHALNLLRNNLGVFKTWGKGRDFKSIGVNRYQFEIPGKRYTLTVDKADLPTNLSVEMMAEKGYAKAADIRFEFQSQSPEGVFNPEIPDDVQQVDMQAADIWGVTNARATAHLGQAPVRVGLIAFDVSKSGNVFMMVHARQVRVELTDDKGEMYLPTTEYKQWNFQADGTVPYYWATMYVPLGDSPWTPRKYKMQFSVDMDPTSEADWVQLGTLEIDAKKPTCEVAPHRFLDNMASPGRYMELETKSLETRAKALKDVRRDSSGKLHLFTTGVPPNTGEVYRQDPAFLRKAIEIHKDLIRLSMVHMRGPNVVRANAYSQIYDVYRYSLGQTAEARRALDLTFEIYKLLPERARETIEIQDARSVLGEEGLLDLIPQ